MRELNQYSPKRCFRAECCCAQQGSGWLLALSLLLGCKALPRQWAGAGSPVPKERLHIATVCIALPLVFPGSWPYQYSLAVLHQASKAFGPWVDVS